MFVLLGELFLVFVCWDNFINITCTDWNNLYILSFSKKKVFIERTNRTGFVSHTCGVRKRPAGRQNRLELAYATSAHCLVVGRVCSSAEPGGRARRLPG